MAYETLKSSKLACKKLADFFSFLPWVNYLSGDLWKLNEEGLLKVSLKNFHPVQSYRFFKNAVFFKNGLKNLTKVEKLEFFFAFLVTIL